ncbi:MAG: hypothetical protein NVSMB38_19830 [Ktedonobacteraceae bacterium]
MNELAGQSLGGYQLEEEIGHGSMGVVYRGKQLALEREVAIKVLPKALARDTSYIARFIREAQIIAGLNHPNIVHIYDAGQQNKLLYFVMEYIQGPTLSSLLYLDGTITQHLALEYGAQIADALDAAYKERNVIHRDIKPENLMLDRWGKIKVMDFGLARAMGQQPITVARTLVGSIYYASPEQVWGYTLDNRSDVYALGVVLYEMVTGQRPFIGRSMPELTQAIIAAPLRPPSTLNEEVAPDLERIILNAMARDREERYEDAGLMARDLRALQVQPATLVGSSQPAEAISISHNQRERVTVQPPKRPNAHRPTYQDSVASSPALEDAIIHPLPAIQEPHILHDPDRPTLPMVISSRPLSLPLEQQETIKTMSSPSGKTKRTFWSQLQHFFKVASR